MVWDPSAKIAALTGVKDPSLPVLHRCRVNLLVPCLRHANHGPELAVG